MSFAFEQGKKKYPRVGRSKKHYQCTNCGKHGHTNKHCSDPVTSYGIIGIKLDNDLELTGDLKVDWNRVTGINIDDSNDIAKFGMIKEQVKFLFIRRKHTLGYMEFVRGHYRVDNFDGIIFLFEQMTPEEIQKIANAESFDQIWTDLWNGSERGGYEHEKEMSRRKYIQLLEDDEILNLNYYTKEVVPAYNIPEWGFPKGRRNYQERDLVCAVREFIEETDLTPDNIQLLEGVPPVSEDFIGTNGTPYRHVYYLALIKDADEVTLNTENIHQMNEIGDIGWFTHQDGYQIIRPYHVERRNLFTKVFIMIQKHLTIKASTASES